MEKTTAIVEIECLLSNGREIYLTLELPRDVIAEADGVVTYTRKPEDDIVEEHAIARSQVAYLQQRTRKVPETTGVLRTLGVESLAQSR